MFTKTCGYIRCLLMFVPLNNNNNNEKRTNKNMKNTTDHFSFVLCKSKNKNNFSLNVTPHVVRGQMKSRWRATVTKIFYIFSIFTYAVEMIQNRYIYKGNVMYFLNWNKFKALCLCTRKNTTHIPSYTQEELLYHRNATVHIKIHRTKE